MTETDPTARFTSLRRFSRVARGALADTRPLRTPAYRRLWTAGSVTVIGAQLTVVAVPTQIFALTGSSAYVGLTGLFGLVPLVVFGLWGGAIADAMDRRTLLLISGAGIAAMSLALWVTAASGAGGVWARAACCSRCSRRCLAINQPARSAVIPRLVAPGLLPAANTLNFTVMTFGAVVGPLLAGVLIPVIGLSTLYLLDALALLATLWATLAAPVHAAGRARRCGAGRVCARGGGRVPVRRDAQGAARLVPRRHRRDGVRHAADRCSPKWRSGRSGTRPAAASPSACCSRRSRRAR